ncbi:chaperonin 10-like protein [Tricladium varicosporioides]|nr:chaperonin 10-like protein [Hymenoscyphus varicosporioides]
MAIFQFLDCLLCGLPSKRKCERAATPVTKIQYEIEGKNIPESGSSAESIDSASQFTKQNEGRGIEKKEIAALRQNRALVVASKGSYALLDDHPFPELAHEHEIIISNRATGLNPIDYKSVDYNFCLPEFPWITGREMAGVVEAVGEGVTDFKVGDHVWTSTYYRDRRAGCFQSFVTVPSHTALPLPLNLPFTHAACLGVAGLTAAMTLWRWLDIPMPTQPDSLSSEEYLLVWGGSTSTGQFAIQLTRLSGLKVVAVTSGKTAGMVRSLGAEVVVRDGKSNEEILADILALTGDTITRAIDLVGTKTAPFCLQAFSKSRGGVFAPLAMMSSKEVVPENVRVETVEMKQFVNDKACRKYGLELNKLVEDRKIRLPELHIIEGGLDVVVDGLEKLKGGDLGGRKMVVVM